MRKFEAETRISNVNDLKAVMSDAAINAITKQIIIQVLNLILKYLKKWTDKP